MTDKSILAGDSGPTARNDLEGIPAREPAIYKNFWGRGLTVRETDGIISAVLFLLVLPQKEREGTIWQQ